jgi:hypothetical protein
MGKKNGALAKAIRHEHPETEVNTFVTKVPSALAFDICSSFLKIGIKIRLSKDRIVPVSPRKRKRKSPGHCVPRNLHRPSTGARTDVARLINSPTAKVTVVPIATYHVQAMLV